ncbi:MAG: hypothetical protein LBB61_03475 [Treponema sp.]|jgi:membrane protein DedA with SNARE-associated domain|nr:hypothetical protein [Treponema sp.]
MWRLIGIVIVLLIYLIFILLNQDTKGVVSLGFLRFENVHTYIITFFAFAAGIITSEIFFIIGRFKKRKKVKAADAAAAAGMASSPETAPISGKEE